MQKRAPSAIVIAAWLSSNVVEGCAVMSSGDCVESATCADPETPVGPGPGDPAAVGGELVEGDTLGPVEMAEDVASTGMGKDDGSRDGSACEVAGGLDARSVASDVGPEEALTTEDATTDGASGSTEPEASTASSDAGDALDVDAATSADSAVEGAREDAADEGPTCTASLCTNTCVPYFVPCCKPAGGCGCSLLFPPGPCL